MKLNKIPIVISIIMLFLAIPSGWPYGYYTILRFVVCGTSIYMALFFNEIGRKEWQWVMGLVGLLFNPVIPIHLNKEIWIVLDPIVGIIFLIGLFFTKK